MPVILTREDLAPWTIRRGICRICWPGDARIEGDLDRGGAPLPGGRGGMIRVWPALKRAIQREIPSLALAVLEALARVARYRGVREGKLTT